MTPELLERLASELRASVRGEVRFDALTRALYATDASPYEILPYGVVVPEDRADVAATLEVARRHGVPVLPRGGGTSLAGQTVGAAIVIDVSKRMNRVLELDPEARRVRVEPGVVRDELNRILAPHRLQFTPDVSTTNRANIGGMVANNSAGTRSIKYGKSVDQVVSMTVMLSDGEVLELGPLSPEELDAACRRDDRYGRLHRELRRIAEGNAAEVEARFPKVMRRVGGYNLDELTSGAPFNLAKIVAGSEGTLGIILDVTLELHPVPSRRMLALLHFATLDAALRAVAPINRHGPSAVEILDDALFALGRDNPALAPLLGWLHGEPEAVLMVEFDGEDEAELRRGLEAMLADPDVADLVDHVHEAWTAEAQAEVLEFRRGGLGIYATVKGRHKPTAFIEDAAIPPEALPSYIPAVKALCERHGVRAVFYGHASVGVIHVRPLLDLKTEEGVRLYRTISEETFELVVAHGGSWSGEHGDGLIRAYKNRELFGERLYEAFREIKRAFDPLGLMNPGKIVDAPPMSENLRYGPGYPDVAVATAFDFSEDGGVLGAVEACTGVGACRKVGTGTMCPSYMATRDEEHSTRGRANALREALTGRLPGGMASDEVHEALELCLECKACKSECPSRVDMAKLKYEALHQRHEERGVPLPTLLIGNVPRIAPLAQKLAPLANLALPLAPVRWATEKVVGVDRRRTLPSYARRDFGSWFRRHERAGRGDKGSVALFADTWTMFNETGPGVAATRVLERLGYAVELVPYGCCGRPQISKGLLGDARRLAERNVARMERYVERGVPVVGLEPSCVAAFQDDYRDLVPGEATERVAKGVKMIDQFLAKEWTEGRLEPGAAFRKRAAPVMLHGHCQQKAVMGTAPTRAVLGWTAEEVRELDAGCCGMAGSFGYAHHDLSMKIGEQRLFPAVREHDAAGGETVACGFSCRHQIRDGTGRSARHVAEALADALAD